MTEPTFDSLLVHFNEKLQTLDVPALQRMRARIANVFPQHLDISPVIDVLEVIDGLMAIREIQRDPITATCAEFDSGPGADA